MNRFSKDINPIDNTVSDSMRMFLITVANILGSFVLIAILIPLFLVAVGVIMIIYDAFGLYSRASGRELKRLDAVLRSSLYAHFWESLASLATIRAYGETERSRKESEDRVNIENRAYLLTVTNQCWLGIRVDMLGLLLTLIVAILTVAARFSISPSQTGVALSYIIGIQQSFGWLVRQVAELENGMNSVERITHYVENLEQEPPHEIPERKPKAPWPAHLLDISGVKFFKQNTPSFERDSAGGGARDWVKKDTNESYVAHNNSTSTWSYGYHRMPRSIP